GEGNDAGGFESGKDEKDYVHVYEDEDDEDKDSSEFARKSEDEDKDYNEDGDDNEQMEEDKDEDDDEDDEMGEDVSDEDSECNCVPAIPPHMYQWHQPLGHLTNSSFSSTAPHSKRWLCVAPSTAHIHPTRFLAKYSCTGANPGAASNVPDATTTNSGSGTAITKSGEPHVIQKDRETVRPSSLFELS
ncbi:hypothetical protein MMC28_010838, partial [Mycoblastus sanguinarius]|nr:hypothetical protein [Mycoblastus sanguinarius]